VTSANGLDVYARRFDWGDQVATPTLLPVRVVETVLQGYGTLVLGGVAYDTVTRSHWAVQFRHENTGLVGSVRVHRVGSTGANVEKAVAFTNDGTPLTSAVTFHVQPLLHYFQVCHNSYAVLSTVQAVSFFYAGASSSASGTGCGGSVVLDNPFAG